MKILKGKYYFDTDRHWFKINNDGSVLHIMKSDFDKTYEQIHRNFIISQEIKKGDVCINLLDMANLNSEKLIEISKETFENTLREAIFGLGIHEYSKQNC